MKECESERMWIWEYRQLEKIMWNKKMGIWDYVKIVMWIWENVNIKKCQYERMWIWKKSEYENDKCQNNIVIMRECEYKKMGTLDNLNNVYMRECIMKNCENVRNISECESEKNVNRRELEYDQMWIWLGIWE